jgi:acyl-CoA synthetase (AMP-forming)/AMP-acid ligase II
LRIYEADFPVPQALLAPGAPYELERRRLHGQDHLMFKHGPRTLSELLASVMEGARRWPQARMTEQDGVITTFGEFRRQTIALAHSLAHDLGVRPGQHVAITMVNRAEWMTAFFAVAAVGAVPVLVNSRGAGEEMARAIEFTDCALSITDRERHIRLLEHAKPGWRSILLDASDLLDPGRDLDWASAARPRDDVALAFAPREPEDPALLMFSSGTTGHPKAVVHCQAGMAHTLTLGWLINEAFDALYVRDFGEALPAHLRIGASTQILSSPMFHVAGLLPFMRALMGGHPTILVTKWNAETVFDIVEREPVSRLGLVPTMIFDMLASPRSQGGVLDKIQFLANGTAALSPAVAAKIRQALPRCLMLNTYGQTETMERVTTFGGREYEANLEASGRVIPTNQLRIVRDDGADAEPGEAGEICARGPTVMLGYYKDPKATAETLQDGWLRTGDIGRFDEQGLLHVVDRKKNMVISGGENIYCAEVERVLSEHPAVAEAIAFGEPDARLGERLVAVVVRRAGAEITEEEMKAYAKGRLAIYKVPRGVNFTDTPLPRNATGKVARGEFLKGLASRA